MIIDLNKIDSDPFKNKKFDVCVCGAGVAGITIARKLSQQLNIVLLEAGDYEYSNASMAAYKGTSIGREYYDLDVCRLRFLGGSSNHWEGTCRMLDSYDFERKPYAEISGWPIKHSDLDPYIDEAKSILDIPVQNEKLEDTSLRYLQNAIDESQDFKSIKHWQSAPTKFGEKYKTELEHMPNLTCYLNANVVDIALAENMSNVEHLKVSNYADQIFKVHARITIIAAGGIENPRILLNCNDQIKEGLGNKAGLVGRFFAEHPHHNLGGFILQDHVIENLAKTYNSNNRLIDFSPSHRFMQQERILNIGFRLHLLNNFDPSNGSRSSFKKKLKTIICDSAFAKSSIETIQGKSFNCKTIWDGNFRMFSEQTPNPLSQISLGPEKDKFGNNRIVLDWRLSEIDKRTIQRAAIRFSTIFADLGLGRVQLYDWVLSEDKNFELPGLDQDIVGGNHHMCTTRMGYSPRDGVVDSNQKMFGLDNLYVAGSSVFSTSGGHANPTFTIVQMTLRLADHLNKALMN